MPRSRGFFYAWIICGASIALAQTSSVNISANFTTTETLTNRTTGYSAANVAPVGNATIRMDTSQPVDASGNPTAAATGTVSFNFNRLDSFSVSINIPVSSTGSNISGTISAGSGAYKGATGTANLSIARGSSGAYTISGTGNVTASGKTTAFSFSNSSGTSTSVVFDTIAGTGTAAITPLSSKASATLSIEVDAATGTQAGTMTIAVSSADSVTLYFNQPMNSTSPVSATVAAGTGAYATATGTATLTPGGSAPNLTFTGTGSIAQHAAGVPVITEVATAYGVDEISQNGWIAIKGKNLVSSATPADGVNWSGALEFLFGGRMPTQLLGVTVSVNGMPAFIYFYCSAATNPTGCPSDQINVLTPLDNSQGPVTVVVNNNGSVSSAFVVPKREIEPSFLLLNTSGYIVATHLDYSLVGPASLYPGYSTPAKAGETIALFAVGFGVPSTPIVNGAAVQYGALPQTPSCFIGSVMAQVTAAYIISPGLTQLNVVIPSGTPSGDNLFYCEYQGSAAAAQFTPAGNLLTVQ